MKTVLITSAEGADYSSAQSLALEVKAFLNTNNVVAHLTSDIDVPDIHPDTVIAIGGDGTIMRAMKKYSQYEVPTFGINGGDVGFLAAAEADNWQQQLQRMLSNEHTVEKRLGLQVRFDGTQHIYGPFANEVFVQHPQTLIDYRVTIAGQQFFGAALRARGIMVATATGSTAQNVAEGGPLILPTSSNVALTPMNAGLLNVRPLVLEEIVRGATITFEQLSLKHDIPVEFWGDGGCIEPNGMAQKMIIEKYEKPLLLINFGLAAYERALRSKKGFAR